MLPFEFAEGENLRLVDMLQTPWRRIPLVVIAVLIVQTMVRLIRSPAILVLWSHI